MHQSLRIRPLAFILAILFLLSSAGEVIGVPACPHHDGRHQESADFAADHGTQPHHLGHDGHVSPEDPGSGGHEGHEGLCTCHFVCGTAGAVALAVESTSVLALGTDEAGHSGIRPSEAPLLRRTPPFFLPYANAPPARG